jgi:hypothetical protein
MRRVSLVIAAAGVLALSAGPVHAQSASAEVLFREGRALIKQGKLAAGCDKIDASEKIETSVGTLLNLGDCREKQGRLATAWAAFEKAKSLARRKGGDERRLAEATKRSSSLEARLSSLVIEVKQPVDGLVIKRGTEILERGGWGTAVPVDPDTYTIVAEAPGYQPWRLEVRVDPATRRKIVSVPKLERVPVTEPVVEEPTPSVVVHRPPVVPAEPEYRPRTWSTTRKIAVGAGVVAAGLVGTGFYFGSRAKDLQNQSDAICPTSVCNDLRGLSLNDDAKVAARNANIAFVGGLAIGAVAGAMWFVGKPDDELVVAPVVGSDQAGVSVGGRF